MSDIGYNDNVSVSNRTFHIQTASNIKKGTARCEVFEQGKIISTHDLEFERRRSSSEDSLEGRVEIILPCSNTSQRAVPFFILLAVWI